VKNISYIKILFCLTAFWLAAASPAVAQRDRKKRPADAELNDLKRREAESLFTEGMKYFILEDYTKALGSFQRVSEMTPDEPMVYYKMAEVYSRSSNQDDLGKAAAYIERALKLDKKNKYFYLLAADIYTAQNSFSKAEQVLEALMKELKDTEEYLYQLAAIYQYDRKPEEALRTYNRAESLLGINETSSLQKQKILLEQGKINEAIAEGQKLLAAYPDEERYVIGFAQALAQKGQQKNAVAALEKFLAAHPEAGSSKVLLASFYREAGREKEARDLLKQVMRDPSVDIQAKIIVIETYAAQIAQGYAANQPDADLAAFALGLLEDLLESNSDDPNVYVAGGDLHLSLRQKAEAERQFLAAIQRGTTLFEAWQNLLSLESESEKFDSLVFHSEQGLEIFPNQALLYYFNGYGHLRLRSYRAAAAALVQAKKLSASNPAFLHEINGMLGEAYNGTKEYPKSNAAFEEALAYKPNDDLILNNYSYYLALRKENLEKAERMAAQVARDHPTNSSYLDTYAWVLFAREKYKEARKVMERALQLPGVSFTHYEHYGDILFRLDDVEGAVKQWEKARSLTSQHELIDKKIANRRLY